MISVFGRWYRRKFSDPDAAMLLILMIEEIAYLLGIEEIKGLVHQ